MARPRTGPLGVVTAKGDIASLNAALNLVPVPVGTDGQIPVADAAAEGGFAWKDAGSVPGIGVSEPYMFGSDMGSVGAFYATGGEPDGGEVSPIGSDAEVVVDAPSKTSVFTWSTEFAAAGGTPTRWQLYKNGVALAGEIVTTIGATGTNTPSQGAQSLAGTTFAQGDRLAVVYLDGTAPKRGNIRVAMVTP